ncbi:ABC transporter permease subunit [Halalkalibacterium halodurans]|uniref:ABC transporter permease n=1 Tax=Halalkalibacterium halodurans TaxID=86665 RepID=A0A0M0KMS3_ALKHA|nr:ABC transporter permease subunit [Halalkalibacterium halodurans]MED4162094.1 ABC transporter permease subunit [Halalkalibacterium halodurans]TPE68731.1 ABC transporter permease subunit [Halalkalibacterium halodurans]
MAKKGKRGLRFSLSETQLGYAMVAPALILVIVVTLWPVALSFYNSLFDYRLTDPTRSQTMLSSSVDLEAYVNNYYYLDRSLDHLSTSSAPEHQDIFQDIEQSIRQYHEQLQADSHVKERYATVEEMVNNYEPVRDQSLKYAKLDRDIAEGYQAELSEVLSTVEPLITEADQEHAELYQNFYHYVQNIETAILESNFIGFSHYVNYVQDSRMWAAMSNTLFFTVVSVAAELVLGLAIALLINRTFKGRGLVRVAVLIPWAIPTAVAAMMWRYLYDGQFGVIAHYFEQLGLISDSSVLLSTGAGAMFSIIFADVWKTTPYMALLLLAGLQTIPNSLYEAAKVDGANRIQTFFKITLPLLKSAILVALLFRTLDAFRVFDLIFVLTGGGPANSTESISIYAYRTLFSQQNFGAGSALSVIVFLSVALISFAFIKFIGSDLFEGRTRRS